VRVEWTGGAKTENGGYGIYPVQCERVLIEDCVAKGASDAGIYVGQSKDIVVRRNRASENVAGIEIENSRRADVTENIARGNSGGILVFDLPDLPVKGGGEVRIYANEIVGNNHVNFAAKGNIVASVPAGTGVLVMANDRVEVFDNRIAEHGTANVAVVSYFALAKELKDPAYDPFPEGVYIVGNRMDKAGDKPAGRLGETLAKLMERLPDILWDGVVNPAQRSDAQGAGVPPLVLGDNGAARFANVNLQGLEAGAPRIETDPAPYRGTLPRLQAVAWEGLE